MQRIKVTELPKRRIVLKNSMTGKSVADHFQFRRAAFGSMTFSGHPYKRMFRLVQKLDQSLDVLGRCRQCELLFGVSQTPQADLAELDLIAQFGEQRLDFVSSAASSRKLRCLAELSNLLMHVLIPVDAQGTARR